MAKKPRAAAKPDWKRRLQAAPVMLPDGTALVTLDDARHYLAAQTIPAGESEQQILATAIKAVTGAAHGTDFVMHARTAVSQWVHRNDAPREFDASRQSPHWGKRRLKRDQ